ncbi:IclR family transcriptional regulator [Streptomyces sulphureus]|uniref:IclR family transcriptional regulator n=1 Tax=Streptomyces sulphureus TaxID=47758 RepID=UPI000365670D|nr:helix-turn-helix domain-containing protein [Streptomyces sulphureus]
MPETTAKAHRTVSRVTDILETVAQHGGARMHELAVALEAPKSSVFGLVKGLVSTGYLSEEKGVYRLGPALGNLLTQPAPDIAGAVRPSLEALRDEFGETAMVGIPVGDSLTYLASAESRQPIRYSAPLRVRRPLFPPSAGKVVLAYRTAKQRESYLRTLFDNEDRVRSAMAELAEVRASQVAFNHDETLPDLSATARPVLVGGRLSAVLAVAGPTTRIEAHLHTIAEALVDATTAAAERLGAQSAG